MEPFEERTLFAVGLVAAFSSEDVLLTNNQVLNVAPTELRFRFSENIDASSLITNNVAAIQVTRGNDHILGNGNDIAVNVPVVASGGAGNYEHMRQAIQDAGASAVAAASMFHFTEQTPAGAKKALSEAGIAVRSNYVPG